MIIIIPPRLPTTWPSSPPTNQNAPLCLFVSLYECIVNSPHTGILQQGTLALVGGCTHIISPNPLISLLHLKFVFLLDLIRGGCIFLLHVVCLIQTHMSFSGGGLPETSRSRETQMKPRCWKWRISLSLHRKTIWLTEEGFEGFSHTQMCWFSSCAPRQGFSLVRLDWRWWERIWYKENLRSTSAWQ